SDGELRLMAFEQEELWESANERIPWHERLDDEEAIQNRVHELVSIGNLEAAVSLMLSTPPESPYFYPNALRAVALSSAVSRSLNELAVKVIVWHPSALCCRKISRSLFPESRVLHRWAEHVFHAEHNIWRALVLYIAAGSLQDALAALREAQQPDTAAMFIIACREIHSEYIENLDPNKESDSLIKEKLLVLPGLNPENEDVKAVEGDCSDAVGGIAMVDDGDRGLGLALVLADWVKVTVAGPNGLSERMLMREHGPYAACETSATV
nr:hypothetical protein [Tanacetum cinerariifolium]